MRRFGVEIERDGWHRFSVSADARYRSPGRIHVEGDASSASYFLAAGAIGGGPVRVEGVGRSKRAGRRGVCRPAGRPWVPRFAAATTGSSRAGTGLAWHRFRLQHDPGRGDDRGGGRAVREGADNAAQHRQLAGQGDGSHRGDGNRIAQGRRDGRRRPGLAPGGTAGDARAARRSTPTTITAWRCASRWRRWAARGVRINDPQCVRKTFPDYFAELRRLAK